MYFPTKHLRTYSYFGGPFNVITIIQRALHQSHVNGVMTLKLYGDIGISKYLGCQNFSTRRRLGAQGALM